MTFQNQSNETLSAYWLDYGGKRVLYRRLDGGQSFNQPTFVSHPWLFADASGKCRKIVMPSETEKVVSIR